MNHRIRFAVTALGAVLALTASATPASGAHLSHNPRGRVLGAVFHRAAAKNAQPSSPPSLTFHKDGVVMHSNTTHAIFWEPPGYSFAAADPAYVSIIDGFLGDVAAASGASDNVYSVSTQYSDGTANAAYDSHFAGPITTHDALPASGCESGGGEPCLTDAQLRAEITSVVSANHLPTGLGDMYLLYTPPGIDSCTDSSSGDCSNVSTGFCGYHDYIDTADSYILYANLPYPTTGCGTGQSPTGDSSADDILSTTSHEQNEIITDPLGTAWWVDSGPDAGYEEGDLCNFNYGTTGDGPSPIQHNQTINGDPYYVQLEWSNWDSKCVPSYPLYFSPSAGSAAVGQPVSFTASPTYTSYGWDFGDGHTDNETCSSPATCNTTSHPYSSPGTYTVTLTANGSAEVKRTISVGGPSCQSPKAVSLAGATPVAIQLPCGDGPTYKIVGAGPSYGTLSAIDASHTVTYTPARGFAGTDQFEYEATDSSGATGAGAVTIAVGGAPENHVPPAVSGNAFEATLVTGTVGWWTGTGKISYSYDWQRCDAGGANCVSTLAPDSPSYLVSNADVGHTLRLAVTASNGASATADSAPTAVVPGTLQQPPHTQQKGSKITDVGISTRVLRAVAAKRLTARIHYRLTAAGAVTFTLERGVGGVRRASRCVVARGKPARAQRCLAYLYVARVIRAHQRAGRHRVTLASLFGRRQLAPGAYRVELKVRAAGGGKRTAYVSFQVR